MNAPRPNRFHIALRTRQDRFDDAVAFYTTLLGTTPAKRNPGYAKFDVAEPSINLTLNAAAEVPRGELDHLGIQVWSDDAVDAARSRLETAGIGVRDEKEVDCCYATQNKFWVADPDGRPIELFHVLRDIDEHGHGRPAASSETTVSPTTTAAPRTCCGPECCA